MAIRGLYIAVLSISNSREGSNLAKFSKKTIIFLLLAICLLSVALRYPLVEHERLNDTYVLQILASSIQDNHRALWTFSPLSYLGYYPASYPSGVPFILAELSDLTGLQLSHVILLLDAVIGILLALGVFLTAREFVVQPEYAILAALLATVAPRFVDASYWSASARALFVALAVVAVLLGLRAGSNSRYPLYGLFAVSLFGCVALHHMGVLFLLFGFAYLLSVVGAYMVSRVRFSRSYGGLAKKTAAAYLAVIGTAIAAVPVLLVSSFVRDLDYAFGDTSLFNIRPEWFSMFLHIAASYTNQIGLVLPLAILGIPLLIARARITAGILFIVILPLSFIPILPNAQYSSMLLSPFVAILGAAVIRSFKKNTRKKLLAIAFWGLICASLVLPFWSTARWNMSSDLSGDPVVVDDQYFNDGAYLRQFDGKALMMSNVDLMSLRLSAISGTLFLGTGIEATLIGDVNASAVKGNLTWANEKFPRNLYSWFESQQAPEVQLYVLAFVLNGMSYINQSKDMTLSGSCYFESHSRLLVAVDNHWPSNYVWMWGNFQAKLPGQLRDAEWRTDTSQSYAQSLPSYMIYQSEITSLFVLGIPN